MMRGHDNSDSYRVEPPPEGGGLLTRMKRKEPEQKKKYFHRSINLKIDPAKLSKEDVEKFDIDIEKFRNLQDFGVNTYVRLPDQKTKTLNEEAKNLRKKLKDPGYISGTFVDLAIGAGGAQSYVRSQRDMAIRDILRRDAEVKKIEEDNPDLIKLKSVWFNPAKDASGICTMCGRDGKIVRRHNEPEYNEQLCEVCEVDFFKWRDSLKTIKRKYIQKNYNICKEIDHKYELSQGFLKLIARFEKPVDVYKRTVSNKFKIKGGQLHIDWETRKATMTLSTKEKIVVEFLGDYYYENFPKYGLYSDELNFKNFKKLITDYLNNRGGAFLIRKFKDGNPEYYISIPTRYPMKNKEKIEGCILVSQRRILLYINGSAEFIELYNPYIKKRIYGGKQKEVQKLNKDLCLCDWNRIPKKNHMFLDGLKKKLGFDWIDEHDVIVTKSEDGNRVIVVDGNNENNVIEMSLNRDNMTAELRSDGVLQTLYVVEREKGLDEEDKYIMTDLYIEPKIPMPKRYSGGNLIKYTRHKSKEIARQVVEKAKGMLSKDGSVVLVNYTGIHPEKEAIIPIVSLNDQIKNMLGYDSIYGGSIHWSRLKVLICPNCHQELPERDNGKRYFIRDIFLSNWNAWICEEEKCRKKINNSLIGVSRHIMNSDIKKLLKEPNKKERENEMVESALR